MFCPRCGQQQISDQTKFCSRCGFQLGLVAEMLDHDGFLPQLGELAKGKTPFLQEKMASSRRCFGLFFSS